MSNTLSTAYAVLIENGFAIDPALRDAMEKLRHPRYRIAVIGKFQVGKSTLINRVFLDDAPLPEEQASTGHIAAANRIDDLESFLHTAKPSLTEGCGICTTAVATEVAYGEHPLLEVYPWRSRHDSVDTLEGEKDIEIREEPGTPETVTNPGPEDLRRATTAATPEERLEKARSTALVRLLWPREELSRYVLVDTPGIDDPLSEIINNTTYRILPGVDTAVMVMEPSALEETEVDFLRSRVFKAGLVRMLILVSYKPDSRKLGAGARANILAAIKAQLGAIGMDALPVEIYCYDDTVEGMTLNSASRIRDYLLAYLRENVEASRRDKTASLLRAALRTALLRVRTEDAALRKSRSDREALAKKAEEQEKKCKIRFDVLAKSFEDALDDIFQRARHDMKSGIARAVAEHLDDFENCSSLSQVQQKIQTVNTVLKDDIERVMFDVTDMIRMAIQKLATEYGEKTSLAISPFRETLSAELLLDDDFFARIPPSLVIALDFLITTVLLPTPWFIDIIIRSLAEKFEMIRSFLPANLVKAMLVKRVRDKMTAQVDASVEMAGEELAASFQTMKAGAREMFEQMWRDECGTIRAALDVDERKDPEAELRRLAEVRIALEAASRPLDAE